MKTIGFIYPHHSGGYGCNAPGDNSGEYVPAAVAGQLLVALKTYLNKGLINVTVEDYRAARAAIARAEAGPGPGVCLDRWTPV